MAVFVRYIIYSACPIFVSTVSQTNFIQQPLPPDSTTGAGGAAGQSGALGMGQRMSTGLTTFYMFWYVASVPDGAYAI